MRLLKKLRTAAAAAVCLFVVCASCAAPSIYYANMDGVVPPEKTPSPEPSPEPTPPLMTDEQALTVFNGVFYDAFQLKALFENPLEPADFDGEWNGLRYADYYWMRKKLHSVYTDELINRWFSYSAKQNCAYTYRFGTISVRTAATPDGDGDADDDDAENGEGGEDEDTTEEPPVVPRILPGEASVLLAGDTLIMIALPNEGYDRHVLTLTLEDDEWKVAEWQGFDDRLRLSDEDEAGFPALSAAKPIPPTSLGAPLPPFDPIEWSDDSEFYDYTVEVPEDAENNLNPNVLSRDGEFFSIYDLFELSADGELADAGFSGAETAAFCEFVFDGMDERAALYDTYAIPFRDVLQPYFDALWRDCTELETELENE